MNPNFQNQRAATCDRRQTPARSIIAFVVLVASIATMSADPVAEWKFDGAADLPGGATIKLDTAAPGASNESVLQSGATYSSGSTGISGQWQPFLGQGYLDCSFAMGEKAKNQQGLVTRKTGDPAAVPGNATYRDYLGFKGLGREGKGGTAVLVVSPKNEWAAPGRRGLFGSGHRVDGLLTLGAKGNTLTLRAQSKDRTGETAITQTWDPAKWYFIGASWQQGSELVLYVREMSAEGAAASPAAQVGSNSGPAPELAQPSRDPIAVGAVWINTGNEAYSCDGADARIAYARIDNAYTPAAGMESLFADLGAKK